MSASAPPRVSVAVPLYNEASGIPELLRRISATLDRLPGGPHEIVLVDDGSTDGTLALLEAAAAGDERLVVLSLSRNFGHQAALSAALDQVSGDVTVVMDGDLQDAPELIPAFLEQYARGYDVVYAQRLRRKEAWWLRLCYFVFYRALRRLSRVAVPVDAGDFGLMSRRVVEQLRQAPERHRFLRGLLGRLSPAGAARGAPGAPRGQEQVRIAAVGRLGVGRRVRVLHRSYPRRSAARGDRDGPVHGVCPLCPVRAARAAPVAAGLHRADPGHHVSVGRQPVLPRHRRGVCGPRVRGGQATAPLHRRPHDPPRRGPDAVSLTERHGPGIRTALPRLV